MKKKQCLVTGATGFIGSHIVERLVKEGYSVRCLVRKNSNLQFLQSLNVEFSYGDLSNKDDIAKAIDDCEYVFHSAAHVGDWGTVKEIKMINVEGTRYVLDCCHRQQVKKLIYISTTDVYGYVGSKNVDETCPYSKKFKNWYSQTKIEAEKLVFDYHYNWQLPVVVIRPSTVYGPRSYSLVDEIVQGIKSKMMFLVGDDSVIIGLCHIDNLMDLVFLALNSDKSLGQVYNGCDGSKVTWKEYINALAKITNNPPVKKTMPYSLVYALGYIMEMGYRAIRSLTGFKSRPLLSRTAVHLLGINQDFSIQKAKKELGYEPKVSFVQGIDFLTDYLKERGYIK